MSIPRPQVWPSTAIYLCCHQASGASARNSTLLWEPYFLAHFSGTQSQVFPLPGLFGPSMASWLEPSGNLWASFLKERKIPRHNWGKKNKKAQNLHFVLLSGFVPDWREQLANSSSKAVRIFALSLLCFSSLQGRHVASRQFIHKLPLAQGQSPSHLSFHLTRFKKGVVVVRMEYHTTPTESVYLELLRAWHLDFSSSLLGTGLSQRFWTETSVWGKTQFRKCPITRCFFLHDEST